LLELPLLLESDEFPDEPRLPDDEPLEPLIPPWPLWLFASPCVFFELDEPPVDEPLPEELPPDEPALDAL
jgi:hypothetical protein